MTSSSSPSGILLLDKPVGVSSFAALYPVKRSFRGVRVGHAGTLDPAASGLLVIGIGAATRLLEFMEDMPKRYRFELRLGAVTDTCDAEGAILSEAPPEVTAAVTRADVEDALPEFRGDILQTPPAYSAIKIDGQRAYARARAGEDVVLQARPVRITRIEVVSFEAGRAVLEVDCSKGTYVRSLARDLGARLGCGAHAAGIRRTAIGPFRVEDAVTPPPDKDAPPIPASALLPVSRAVGGLPAVTVAPRWIAGLRNGNPVPADGLAPHADSVAGIADNAATCAAFDTAGDLLAVGALEAGAFRPRKVFPPGTAAPSTTSAISATSATSAPPHDPVDA